MLSVGGLAAVAVQPAAALGLSLRQGILLALVALLFAISNLLLMAGMRTVAALDVMLVRGVTLLTGLVCSALFLDQIPPLAQLPGFALIIASSWMITRRPLKAEPSC